MAEIAAESAAAAAAALMLAGRWTQAGKLLDAAKTDDPSEAGVLALARARLATELAQWRGEGNPAAALAEAAELVGASDDERAAQDLELLRLFSDYWAELQPAAAGQLPRFGPDGHDPAVLAKLRDRAEWLTSAAPDQSRTCRARFYAGLIADNLLGERERARQLFERALSSCGSDDDMIACEALRHLGFHAYQAGDRKLAREHWERSTELAERVGWLPLALSQQLLLAELDQAEGDHVSSRVRAAEIQRWAAAIDVARLEKRAVELSSLD